MIAKLDFIIGRAGTGKTHACLAAMREQMEQKVRAFGLEDKVVFLGRRSDVNELMMAMDCFLLPSRFEGLPIVMVEAQCTGLACVVSDTITREVMVNDNVTYESIMAPADQWAECAGRYTDTLSGDRENGAAGIRAAGY